MKAESIAKIIKKKYIPGIGSTYTPALIKLFTTLLIANVGPLSSITTSMAKKIIDCTIDKNTTIGIKGICVYVEYDVCNANDVLSTPIYLGEVLTAYIRTSPVMPTPEQVDDLLHPKTSTLTETEVEKAIVHLLEFDKPLYLHESYYPYFAKFVFTIIGKDIPSYNGVDVESDLHNAIGGLVDDTRLLLITKLLVMLLDNKIITSFAAASDIDTYVTDELIMLFKNDEPLSECSKQLEFYNSTKALRAASENLAEVLEDSHKTDNKESICGV